ncbi:MAG TPA: GNAT family N-acetyltransferase [bacterium]|nr:GNAT family N-acetyltransferase [bacterium]
MADKPAVLRISRRIWEGNDYVPLFFDRWVEDGGFWAAELRRRIVGYGKATQLSPGEYWLEGLRVDPECRKQGIGKELSRRVLDKTLESRPVSLRLATADVNHESLHIIETVMRFKPLAQYRFFLGEPKKSRPGPALVTPSVAEALHYVRRSSELAASKGLLQYTWLFRTLDRRYMAELARSGYAFGYRSGGSLAGLLVLRPHRYHGNDLDISFVAGNRQALAAFRSFISRVAYDCGAKSISGMAASDEMAAAFASLGLKPHPRIGKVLVYEYPI